MSDVKLGQLIGPDAQRDAIHVAIAPVIAGERLRPGQGIAFEDGSKERVRAYGTTIGIVDPFLRDPVEKEQRFFMCLYPGTITSLRHHWTHPAFSPQAAPELTASQTESERWLRAFAVMNRADYEEMIAGAISGEGYCFGDDDGPENARDWEFWSNLEELTGRTFSDDYRTSVPFRCAC